MEAARRAALESGSETGGSAAIVGVLVRKKMGRSGEIFRSGVVEFDDSICQFYP